MRPLPVQGSSQCPRLMPLLRLATVPLREDHQSHVDYWCAENKTDDELENANIFVSVCVGMAG